MLLEITSATWIVTGLGFGIVLVLLCCLVFILMFFGWVMQKATAPRPPKKQQTSPEGGPHIVERAEPIAKSQEPTAADDIAAVAYALYLAQNKKHDIPTAMISIRKHETAWNEKSIGLNNVGF
ncbi:MAG: OadG family protein [Paludibacteraceae bacterium]|nr:OadG family protein [Paludibacteraceae bacterium]